MKAFLRSYGFSHIPFCECCREHTPFTVLGFSRPVGALTLDSPNASVDPTLIVSNSETKLICSRCGNEMYRFSDKADTAYAQASSFLKNLYSRAELEAAQTSQLGAGCVIFAIAAMLILGGCLGMNDSKLGALLFLTAGAFFVLVGIANVRESTGDIQKLKPFTIKDPSGRPFTFNPEAFGQTSSDSPKT